MDFFNTIPPEWWQWAVSAFYLMDRIWLGLAVAVSVLFGLKLGDRFTHVSLFWGVFVSLVGMVGLFLIFLALAGVNPQFFNAEDLARSQVSM